MNFAPNAQSSGDCSGGPEACASAAEPGSACPTCTGDIKSDSPALSALSFGMLTAEASPAHGGFWNAAVAAEVVRRSSHRDPGMAEFIREVEAEVALPASVDWAADPRGRWRELGGGGPAIAASFPVPNVLFGQASGVKLPPGVGGVGSGSEANKEWEIASNSWVDGNRRTYHPGARPGGDFPHRYGRRMRKHFGPSCQVKSFHYPRCWRPVRNPINISMCFEVDMEFKDDRAKHIYCECCVFRQWIRVTHDGGAGSGADYRIDLGRDKSAGLSYGGSRPDGSGKDTPDTPAAEGAYQASKCTLKFSDTPHETYGDSLSKTVTWDFLGVVYDRCNGWRIEEAQRFMAVVTNSRPDVESPWERSGTGWTNMAPPPARGKDAWTHGKPPKGWSTPPGVQKPAGKDRPRTGPDRTRPGKGPGCCK